MWTTLCALNFLTSSSPFTDLLETATPETLAEVLVLKEERRHLTLLVRY